MRAGQRDMWREGIERQQVVELAIVARTIRDDAQPNCRADLRRDEVRSSDDEARDVAAIPGQLHEDEAAIGEERQRRYAQRGIEPRPCAARAPSLGHLSLHRYLFLARRFSRLSPSGNMTNCRLGRHAGAPDSSRHKMLYF